MGQIGDLPDNIRSPREHVVAIRQRYEMLFLLMFNSGFDLRSLRPETRGCTVVGWHCQVHPRVGKGDKERSVPLPAPSAKARHLVKDAPAMNMCSPKLAASRPGPFVAT